MGILSQRRERRRRDGQQAWEGNNDGSHRGAGVARATAQESLGWHRCESCAGLFPTTTDPSAVPSATLRARPASSVSAAYTHRSVVGHHMSRAGDLLMGCEAWRRCTGAACIGVGTHRHGCSQNLCYWSRRPGVCGWGVGYKTRGTESAAGATDFCIAHGGGRRCQYGGCTKSAAEGAKGFCIAHARGRPRQYGGCTKSAGGTGFCIAHGGGRRCQTEGCTTAARRGTGRRRAAPLQGAWRRQALPVRTAAPVQLKPEGTADRTGGGVSSRAAPSQPKPGRRTAERVHPAHSRRRRAVRRRIEPQT